MTTESAGINEAVSNDNSTGDPCRQSGSSPPPEQNRADAEAYIEGLTGDANTVVTFQTFHDSDKSNPGGRIFHGTVHQHWTQLVALNNAGHGVYVMVNEVMAKAGARPTSRGSERCSSTTMARA